MARLIVCVILLIVQEVTNSYENSNRRAVRLGRRPVEKISIGPKDKLIQLGNLEQSVKAKACLTAFRKARKAEVKAGPSEPT